MPPERYPFTRSRILKLLDKKPHTIAQIMALLEIKESTAIFYLTSLKKDGIVYYREDTALWRKGEPSVIRSPLTDKEKEQLIRIIDANQLLLLAISWSRKIWTPKIFESSKKLPVAIASLYELSVKIANGEVIQQSELDQIKKDLSLFKTDVENLLSVVNGIMFSEELWNRSLFAAYLLKHIEADRAKELAILIQKEHK